MRDTPDVPAPVREVASELSRPQPMRRGSLSERYVKCSKPGCPCAGRPEARHGPYYSLTRAIAKRTQSRFLTAAQAELARRQVEAGRQFRMQVQRYWEVCEQWADAELSACQAASAEAAQKRGSKRASRPRSPRRSKRS